MKLSFAGFALWLASYMLLFADRERITRLATAEKPIEYLGALLFLAAAAACLVRFWRRSPGSCETTPRRTGFLLLGVVFFVAFGEEVSWGQHLFGFRAPEAVRQLNIQKELNLHNLKLLDTFTTAGEKKTGLGALLNANRLFDYFMLLLFLVIPVGVAWSTRLRSWQMRLGVPLVPAPIGVLLILNLLATVLAELFLVADRYYMHIAVSEIREMNYGAVCCLVALCWLSERAAKGAEASSVL